MSLCDWEVNRRLGKDKREMESEDQGHDMLVTGGKEATIE